MDQQNGRKLKSLMVKYEKKQRKIYEIRKFEKMCNIYPFY